MSSSTRPSGPPDRRLELPNHHRPHARRRWHIDPTSTPRGILHSVDIVGAMAIGLAAGILCALAVGLKYRFGYDDSLDVVGVHLVGGVVGTVLIGLFADVTRSADGAVTSYTWAPDGALNGLFYGGGLTQLATQSVIAVNAILISGVMTIIIALALKYTMGWRIPEEHEIEGVDLTTHGEAAYDLEPSSGAGASGVLTGSVRKAQEVTA